MDRTAKEQEILRLRSEADRIAQELEAETTPEEWPPKSYYFTYHVLAGTVLGLFGAATSLLANIVGALIIPPPPPLAAHPLNLIRVYLTFPLGEAALQTDGGVALAIGCCLYLLTGMLLGIPFQISQSLLPADSTLAKRFAVASLLAAAIWAVNFYAVLSWLQPLLFGGDWIVRMIPWWVGLLTHLIFGWTMVLVYPLGVFIPYRRTGANG
jgi:hypothetical protein